MARRFNPSLHPRDANGKFRSKGGGGGSSRSSGSGRTRARRPSASAIVGNVKAARKRAVSAKATRTNKPLGKAKKTPALDNAQKAQIAVHGVNAAIYTRSAVTYGTGAGAAFGTGATPLGVLGASKAALSGAQALNEVHRVKTLTSKQYIEGSVSERSKFDANYGRRVKVLNRAQTATSIVGLLGAAGPVIKTVAGAENNLRRERQNRDDQVVSDLYKRSGGTGAIVPWKDRTSGASPRLAKPKRGGVYDITTIGSKRVR